MKQVQKCCVILLLCLISTGRAVAQNPAKRSGQSLIDSLIAALPKVKEDTQKVKIWGDIAFEYKSINPDEGKKYANLAVSLAEMLKWNHGIGLAYYFRGSDNLMKGSYPEALDDYLKALSNFEITNDKKRSAGALSNIGTVYGYESKDSEALVYFTRALKINREISAKSRFEVANLGNIGAIYFNEKNYTKASEYMKDVIEICEEKNYIELLPQTYSNTGAMYVEMHEPAKAIGYLTKSLQANAGAGNPFIQANNYAYMGQAILQILKDNERGMLKALFNGDKGLALKKVRIDLDSAAMLLRELGDKRDLALVYNQFEVFEEYTGNFKKALDYHRQYMILHDSLFNSSNNDKITQATMQYEFDKREAAKSAEQEKKDLIQRNIRISTLSGAAGLLVFSVVVSRQRNRVRREKRKVEIEKARSEELLLNILPSEVANELKEKGNADPKLFDQVTVLFTDFVGFTVASGLLSPKELVSELDSCFKAFDGITTKYGIEKIKTIGDAYLAVCGLPASNANHAQNIVRAALEIRDLMAARYSGLGTKTFQIRIGIHSGSVVAGIVGVKKFAYDIWGDTVNTAARMEQNSEPGKINISDATYELVKDKFSCEYRGEIQAKGKGEMKMYYVV